jgi:hypothetical protein
LICGKDAAITGTLEARLYFVEAAILVASDGGFQPPVKIDACATNEDRQSN